MPVEFYPVAVIVVLFLYELVQAVRAEWRVVNRWAEAGPKTRKRLR